jgi:hypothetical protein
MPRAADLRQLLIGRQLGSYEAALKRRNVAVSLRTRHAEERKYGASLRHTASRMRLQRPFSPHERLSRDPASVLW